MLIDRKGNIVLSGALAASVLGGFKGYLMLEGRVEANERLTAQAIEMVKGDVAEVREAVQVIQHEQQEAEKRDVKQTAILEHIAEKLEKLERSDSRRFR